MTEPFIGEIRTFGFSFAPRDWTKCDGQTLPIQQNETLYSLLGTTYGGDGRTTFQLPDLRGRTALSFGAGTGLTNVPLGQSDGAETVALQAANLPQHTHALNATTSAANSEDPSNHFLAKAQTGAGSGTDVPLYNPLTTLRQMSTSAITSTGGGQGLPNMQPFLVVNFCLSLSGTFPPRN